MRTGDGTPSTVRIVARTDIDWLAMTREGFAEQSDRNNPLLTCFIKFTASKDVFSVWDKVSVTDYFEFRRELQRISEDNFAAVRGARISTGLNDFAEWLYDPQDEWLVPVDDDDYFHPALAERLQALDDSINVAYWPEYHYVCRGSETHGPYQSGLDLGEPEICRTRDDVLWTNNWAIRKSFLREHFDQSEARRVLTDHWFASIEIGALVGCKPPPEPAPWYEFELAGPGIYLIPEALSITLKHPASLFFLWNILQHDDPISEITDRRFGDPAEFPEELEWSAPWVRRAEELFDRSLAERRRLLGNAR